MGKCCYNDTVLISVWHGGGMRFSGAVALGCSLSSSCFDLE